MPTKTFFGLPKEKQDRLLMAARKEFSRVPIYESSIANIVKYAEIPRGSFYQYFEDKEDLFFYYVDSLKAEEKDIIVGFFKEENGDIFNSFTRYFDRIIQEILFGPDAAFYKNLFLHMDYRASHKVSPNFYEGDEKEKGRGHEKHKNERELFLKLINTDNLKITDEKDVFVLLRLIVSFIFASINFSYKSEQFGKTRTLEEIKADFRKKMEWLKYGALKEGEQQE